MRDQSLVREDALDELIQRAARDIDSAALPACQFALAREGQIVSHVALGGPDTASRFTVFSVTKALVAAGTWLLLSDGSLSPTTKVVDLVPEFGTNGKDVVTLEHLLTHTSGFARAPMRPEDGATTEGRLRRFASWRLDWEPGTRMEYHASSAHWVVAEMMERVTGRDYRKFLHDDVIAPLGLEHLRLGVDPADGADIVDVQLVGQTNSGGTERGGGIAEINDTTLLRYNDADARAVGVPGGGAVSTAADIALLYQAMLHNEPRLWDPDVLADGTGHVRNVFVDPLRGVPANRTLGLVVAGDDPQGALLREFGRATGPRAFGASGVGGQIAWADPDSGLSFCWLTNGLDADIVAMFKRSASLSTRAAKCVPTQEGV